MRGTEGKGEGEGEGEGEVEKFVMFFFKKAIFFSFIIA